jgi:hypothetical protein
MARDLAFQGVNVLGQNELKLTYKRANLNYHRQCRKLFLFYNHMLAKILYMLHYIYSITDARS